MPAAGANNPRPGEVVVLVGLQRAAQHNYAAASVLDAAADDSAGTGDRLAVRLLHHGTRLSVRRRNLVRCCSGARGEESGCHRSSGGTGSRERAVERVLDVRPQLAEQSGAALL